MVMAGSPQTDRIASLDLIRGVAVLGILAANVIGYGQPFSAYMWPGGFLTPPHPADEALWLVQFVLIDGKLRGLFSLLFGAGMMLFMEKAWARGQSRWLQARRLGWLALFGLAHHYLLWSGDILVLYAVCGLLALGCLRWSARMQLTAGLGGYLFGAALYALGYGGPLLDPAGSAMPDPPAEMLADEAVEQPIMQAGSYADLLSHVLAEHALDPLWGALASLLETFPMLLIGMAVYRLGLFGGTIPVVRLRRWGWGALGAGGVLSLSLGWWTVRTGLDFGTTMAAFLGLSPVPRLAMTMGLACLLVLWARRAQGWLADRLSAAGRMAFSNYIGSSLVMVLLFHPWAGGLWGELTRLELYLAMVLGWALMLGWSQPWLARFRMGPLEWLWRCLTYGQLFPLRR